MRGSRMAGRYLDARPSGVTRTAVPGAHPVANGGVRVNGWAVVDPAKHLWSAPGPAGRTDTRQPYVDGLRGARAVGRLPVSLTLSALRSRGRVLARA
jgi:hypothetical protein